MTPVRKPHKPVAFRLSLEAADILAELASSRGQTQTAILERLLREEGRRAGTEEQKTHSVGGILMTRDEGPLEFDANMAAEEWIDYYRNKAEYPKHWRLGQAAMNLLQEIKPGLYNEVRGSDIDPYHFPTVNGEGERIIELFETFLRTNWNREEKVEGKG